MQRLALKKEDSVYALIHSRQLAAHAVASKRGGKPRWKISQADLEEYLNRIRQAPASHVREASAPRRIAAKRYVDRTQTYAA